MLKLEFNDYTRVMRALKKHKFKREATSRYLMVSEKELRNFLAKMSSRGYKISKERGSDDDYHYPGFASNEERLSYADRKGTKYGAQKR